MRALRSILFSIWLYGTLAVFGLVYLPAAYVTRTGANDAARAWSRAVIWGLRVIGGVTVEVRGLEHAPKGAGLVAAKHQSMLDTIVPFAVLARPAFVLKRELMRLPIYSLYAARGGHIPVDRDGGASALKTMIRVAQAAIGRESQVLIFPEGTRTQPGDAPDYKPGVAALYQALGVPCTPVALNTGLAWSARGVDITPGKVVMEFLPPIPAGLPRRDFMARLEAAIEARSNALLPAPPAPRPLQETSP